MIFRTAIPVVIAAVISSLAPTVPAVAATPHQPPPGITSLITKADRQGHLRVIVQTADMRSKADLHDILSHARAKYQIHTEFERFPLIVMEADSTTLKMLSSARGVVRVAEDTLDKPVFDRPWHTRAHHGGHPASGHARPERGRPTLGETIPLIGADKVHALGGTGAHQAVAILDTGIDRTHPFLAGRVVAEACYSNAEGSRGQSLCPNGQASQVGTGAADATTAACRSGGEDLCFHGTHVAGIAAGRKVTGAPADGVAPGADIIAIQVFTRQNSAAVCGGRPPCALSYLSDQLLGLQKVMELSDRYSIAAVNMSLGGAGVKTSPCDSDMRKIAIDALLNRRIATVIAAGNDGATGASVPGCISSAVTVGATDDHDAVADFTNRGQLLDLFAPGVDVTSSVPGGGYYQLSGTSMATPHVTGSFAVLRQARPDATVADILGTLERTGKGVAVPAGAPQPGDSGSLRTRAQVTPRIDLYAAWTALTAPPNKA